jgi:hypothetical protein
MTDQAVPGQTIYVVYTPYLPLTDRTTVGDWELIPRAAFQDEDAIDPHVATLARGFADLHELPGSGHGRVGAFARRRAGKVGDDPEDLAPIIDLRRALVVAVLDGNESPLLPEEEQNPNAGHNAMTSDNAIVVANGISRDGGWTATITGGRIRTLHGGLSVLPDHRLPSSPKIAPPGDIHLPPMPPKLDVEYADAAWESIGRGTDDARRLARAIDWLDLAWRNASGLTDDLRVPALRAGFEVLLDSDETPDLRGRLSDLLDAQDAPTLTRHWRNPKTGKIGADEMTDLGWWFTRFSFLRNDLMHGRIPSEQAWIFDGRRHVDLGEWWLRQAIKETIAREGHGDVREDPVWRDALRSAAKFLREHADTNSVETAGEDER